jgi:hypothetical protein
MRKRNGAAKGMNSYQGTKDLDIMDSQEKSNDDMEIYEGNHNLGSSDLSTFLIDVDWCGQFTEQAFLDDIVGGVVRDKRKRMETNPMTKLRSVRDELANLISGWK